MNHFGWNKLIEYILLFRFNEIVQNKIKVNIYNNQF